MVPQPLSRRRAFTLVELLVVVSIIALLTLYADEYDGWYTPIRWTSVSLDEGYTWAWNPGFRDMLDLSPIDVAEDLQSHGDGQTHGGYPEGWGCPAKTALSGRDKGAEIGCVIHSYAMNRSNHPSRNDDMFQEGRSMWAYHRSSIQEATLKIQMMDHNEWNMGMPQADYRARWDLTGEVRPNNGGSANVAYRHNDGTNTLRFDGHVEHMSKEKAWPDNAQDRRDIWRVLQ